jgi:hypothetical protein
MAHDVGFLHDHQFLAVDLDPRSLTTLNRETIRVDNNLENIILLTCICHAKTS